MMEELEKVTFGGSDEESKTENPAILEELKDIIGRYVEIKDIEIQEESRFVEDLGFNSYDFMSMIGEIEDEFDVEVDEREIINVKTVRAAIEYIKKLQAE